MIIEVWVKPGSKKGDLVIPPKGNEPWEVFVAAKAIDGDANSSVINLLASHLGVPKSSVSIKNGLRYRRKLIEIDVIG